MAKKYWNRKKQIKKRSKYGAGKKFGRAVGDAFDYFLPPQAKFMGDLGAWAGASNDQWRYKRKVYNKRIRVYKRIGSRPYTGPAEYRRPNPSGYYRQPSGVGKYRKWS